MILYVSGKMSGDPDFNFPKFDEAAKRLRAAGYTVINPAENFGGDQGLERHVYMRLDLQHVLMVDGLALLDDWWESTGATLEVQVAKEISTPAWAVDLWVQRAENGLC